MALINIQRFRDVPVRTGVAEPAPALEVAVGLDHELAEMGGNLATKPDLLLLRADLEASLHRQTVLILGIVLTGLALAVGILGLIIALT